LILCHARHYIAAALRRAIDAMPLTALPRCQMLRDIRRYATLALMRADAAAAYFAACELLMPLMLPPPLRYV